MSHIGPNGPPICVDEDLSWSNPEIDDGVEPKEVVLSDDDERESFVKRCSSQHSLNSVSRSLQRPSTKVLKIAFESIVHPDLYRIYFWLAMWVTIFFCVILTLMASDLDFTDNYVQNVFGTNSICTFFDFFPANVFGPAMWNICALFRFVYNIFQGSRIYLLHLNNVISFPYVYLCIVIFEMFTFASFAVIYGVFKEDLPQSLSVHIMCFVLFIIATCLGLVKDCWFMLYFSTASNFKLMIIAIFTFFYTIQCLLYAIGLTIVGIDPVFLYAKGEYCFICYFLDRTFSICSLCLVFIAFYQGDSSGRIVVNVKLEAVENARYALSNPSSTQEDEEQEQPNCIETEELDFAGTTGVDKNDFRIACACASGVVLISSCVICLHSVQYRGVRFSMSPVAVISHVLLFMVMLPAILASYFSTQKTRRIAHLIALGSWIPNLAVICFHITKFAEWSPAQAITLNVLSIIIITSVLVFSLVYQTNRLMPLVFAFLYIHFFTLLTRV